MTSIKEALTDLIEAVERDANSPDHRGISGYTSARLSDARTALASLSCGEARERIARTIKDALAAAYQEREEPTEEDHLRAADAILATGCVPGEAAKATDGDEAYEIGKRDGYESAIQDIDIATGGDGEFKGSTIPGVTVDVPAMKARVIERLRDESRLRQCTICGFTVDTSFAAVKPSADFTTRGRAKSLPNESAIRADERERCAKVAEAEYADKNWHAMYRHAAGAIAAAIRSGGGE